MERLDQPNDLDGDERRHTMLHEAMRFPTEQPPMLNLSRPGDTMVR